MVQNLLCKSSKIKQLPSVGECKIFMFWYGESAWYTTLSKSYSKIRSSEVVKYSGTAEPLLIVGILKQKEKHQFKELIMKSQNTCIKFHPSERKK